MHCVCIKEYWKDMMLVFALAASMMPVCGCLIDKDSETLQSIDMRVFPEVVNSNTMKLIVGKEYEGMQVDGDRVCRLSFLEDGECWFMDVSYVTTLTNIANPTWQGRWSMTTNGLIAVLAMGDKMDCKSIGGNDGTNLLITYDNGLHRNYYIVAERNRLNIAQERMERGWLRTRREVAHLAPKPIQGQSESADQNRRGVENERVSR
jgi:hypothetical protein